MAESTLFTDIEKAYLSDNYQEVITIWEKHKKNYSVNFETQNDRKILQALVVSYSELNRTEESIYYINKYIHFLKKQKNNLNGYSEDIDFYFLAKSSIYSRERKRLYEYKTLHEYIRLGGKNDKLIKSFREVEDFLFQSYRKFNLYFTYVFIGVIILNNIFRFTVQTPINPSIMTLIVVIGLLWIGINYLSKDFSRKLFKILIDAF